MRQQAEALSASATTKITTYSANTVYIIGALLFLILFMAFLVQKYRSTIYGKQLAAAKQGFEPGEEMATAGGAAPAAMSRAPIDLSTAGPNPGPCAAGMTPVTYQNPDGSLLTRCVSSGPSVIADPTAILSACGQTWDPAATAEAQALATVGSFQHDSYGERKLQNAINAAYDSNVGLTDDQLAQVMAGGS